MSARELLVLGSASQVPTRHRNHNGYLLCWDAAGLLFDPGEGTQRQLTRFDASVSQLTHLFVSHFHGDHCLGLPGIVQRLSLDGVPHEVPAFYPASGQVYWERLRHASVFQDRARVSPRPLSHEGLIAREPAFELHARRLSHPVESWGYRLTEPAGFRMVPELLAARGISGPAVGELLRRGELTVDGRTVRREEVGVVRPGQSFAFVMDTRLCDAAFALAEGVDLLVIESTFLASEAAEARRHGHLTAGEAGRVAAEAGARRVVLTHFSQRYPTEAAFFDEASAWHSDVVVARDGCRVAVPPRVGAERPGEAAG